MRKVWIAAVVALVGLSPVTLAAETLTDALISAYRNSHLLDQNQAVLRARDEDLATAVGTLLPVLRFQASIDGRGSISRDGKPSDLSLSDTATLIASMPILDFGRGQFGINLRNEIVLASQQSLVNVEQQVLFDAVTAYVDMGLQGELVAAQESNVRLISQDLRAARDRFDVGEVTRTDVALAEAQLAAANAALAAAQGNYNVARERYNAAIGHYPDKLSGLPKWPKTASTLAEARQIALRNHPVILQLQHEARAADFGVDFARADMLPSVSGDISMSRSFFNGKSSLIGENIGITLNQTIYSGGQKSSALRKAIANSQETHARLMQIGVSVEEAVGNAWSNILVAKVSIEAGDQQIRAAQAAYDGVKQEAELGSRTTLDVLDAEQNLLSARASRLQAAANLYKSQYQLLSAMGLLTANHLRLGIPTFDPNAYLNAVKNAPATSGRGAKLDRILKTLGK